VAASFETANGESGLKGVCSFWGVFSELPNISTEDAKNILLFRLRLLTVLYRFSVLSTFTYSVYAGFLKLSRTCV